MPVCLQHGETKKHFSQKAFGCSETSVFIHLYVHECWARNAGHCDWTCTDHPEMLSKATNASFILFLCPVINLHQSASLTVYHKCWGLGDLLLKAFSFQLSVSHSHKQLCCVCIHKHYITLCFHGINSVMHDVWNNTVESKRWQKFHFWVICTFSPLDVSKAALRILTPHCVF